MTLEDRQHELQSRISQIDSDIAALDARFLQLAAEFNSADGNASLRSAEQIEQRLMQLRREKALSIASQAHIVKQIMDERQTQAEAERRATLADARKLADAICTLNAELDTHLTQLREMFERRFALLSQLAATGIVDSGFITKLQGKSGATRAFCCSGLHRFVAVEKVGQTSFVPLASVNPILLGIGAERRPSISSTTAAGAAEAHVAAPAPTNGNIPGGNNANGGQDATLENPTDSAAEATERRNRLHTYGSVDDADAKPNGDEPERRRRLWGRP